ncbi:MAG TPA: response regulator [Methylomirabilota bacterium]|jgi:CheY-like chemotaxis protein/predicted regulator of Ras-like GTPase activity (Roadblock/LC7/MglB family)
MPKVMVVDDSLSVRKVVERALATRNIGVVSAASGSEALEALEREAPDVVVCDVVMPDRDGYQICDYIKNHPRLAKTPVLLISGIVNNTVLEKAAKVNSNGVMGKPFAAEDLLKKIDDLLAAAGNGNGHAAPAASAPAPAVEPTDARLSFPRDAGAPAAATADAPASVSAVLAQFAALPGVELAALVDREGFVVEATAPTKLDTEVAGAFAACLAESTEGIGRELERGNLHGMILEYERGMVVLHSVGSAAILGIVLGDPASLGKVRYLVKKVITDLQKAV